MSFRKTLALAAAPILSAILVGCNPPIDEKKADTAPVTPTSEPRPGAPAETKPGEGMTPAPSTTAPETTPTPAPGPAVEPPKADDKPADAPKDEPKKDEMPKS